MPLLQPMAMPSPLRLGRVRVITLTLSCLPRPRPTPTIHDHALTLPCSTLSSCFYTSTLASPWRSCGKPPSTLTPSTTNYDPKATIAMGSYSSPVMSSLCSSHVDVLDLLVAMEPLT